MQIIKHRINTIEQLKDLNPNYGAEIDIRYHNDMLVIDHDPMRHHLASPTLVTLRKWLQYWKNSGPLILNVKTEGIEENCIGMMKEFGITNWFFLDLSMPYFIKYARKAAANPSEFGPQNLAVRFSEFEPIEYALAFKNMSGWVWVDYFTHSPLSDKSYQDLKKAGFKICLVSPELQQHNPETISILRNSLGDKEIDAVCTKFPELW